MTLRGRDTPAFTSHSKRRRTDPETFIIKHMIVVSRPVNIFKLSQATEATDIWITLIASKSIVLFI